MDSKGRIATVGTFDGVHTGHLAVIGFLKTLAASRDLTPVVITFDRHPLETVAPARAPLRLMDPGVEAERLRSLGVEVRVEAFTPALMKLSAREWMERIRSGLGVEALVVGYDNTFGCDGVDMSVADYARLGAGMGIRVDEAPVVAGVSSSAIRKALLSGDAESAGRMLGRPYRLGGTVVKGRQLGRQLGFPTANVSVPSGRLVPARGVYAATALLDDGQEAPAVVNIGVCPTVAEGLAPTVEAHLIGVEADLYGRLLTLDFTARLRGERRFGSLSELKAQIASDVRDAECLSSRGSGDGV